MELRAKTRPPFLAGGGWGSVSLRRSSLLRIFDIEQRLHDLRQVGGFAQSSETVVQRPVQRVELVVDDSMLGVRSERLGVWGCHRGFGCGEGGRAARQYGRSDRGAQRTRLTGAGDL